MQEVRNSQVTSHLINRNKVVRLSPIKRSFKGFDRGCPVHLADATVALEPLPKTVRYFRAGRSFRKRQKYSAASRANIVNDARTRVYDHPCTLSRCSTYPYAPSCKMIPPNITSEPLLLCIRSMEIADTVDRLTIFPRLGFPSEEAMLPPPAWTRNPRISYALRISTASPRDRASSLHRSRRSVSL